jgi:hypothetical protein
MLQVLCLDVAKMDLDVAYTCMFQVFFGILYVCLQVFLWMLHMFAMIFKYFSGIFASVSDIYFKCFIYLLLYVATVASECFKSRSGTVLHMGCAWEAATSDTGDVRGGVGNV